MSRYPFRSASLRYLEAYEGVYAETTWKELDRRFRRLEAFLMELKASGDVSTIDPSALTPEDVKALAVYLRRVRHISPAAQQHDIGVLGNLCLFTGNDCVRLARARYPAAFPIARKVRGSVLTPDEFAAIVRWSGSCTGGDLRDATTVCLALGTGARPCEIREARVEDLNLIGCTFYVRRPKGADTYGACRTVPVRPEVRGILSLYISSSGLSPTDLILGVDGHAASSNTLGIWRGKVCDGVGFDFDFRKLRRTYGQYLLDEGFSMEEVSILLGHTNVTTTNTFYAGVRPSRAVQNVLSGWQKSSGSDDGNGDEKKSIAEAGITGAREGI